MKRRSFFGVIGAAIAGMAWGRKVAVANPVITIEQNGVGDSELYARTFVAEETRISTCNEIWTTGCALVLGEFVTPEISWHEPLWCKGAIGSFLVGDHLLVRDIDPAALPLSVTSTWLKITGELMDGGPHGYYAWIVEHVAGGKPGMAISEDAAIINFGQVSGVPFVQMGNLSGLTGLEIAI